jgi:hypothetical protein
MIGNLPPGSVCHVCETECGTGQSLCDFRCCWCQWAVHSKCLPNLAELCTLGTFRNFIIPPNCITLKRNRRVRLRSQCVVSSIQLPQWGPQWKPLIVIGTECVYCTLQTVTSNSIYLLQEMPNLVVVKLATSCQQHVKH